MMQKIKNNRSNFNKLLNKIIALFISLILLPFIVQADGYTADKASHSTTYTNVITSKGDANKVVVADINGFEVTTGDVLLGSVSGNVGIGTTSPGARLSLYGNDGINTGMFEIYTKQAGTGSFQKIVALSPTGSDVNDGYFQLSDNGVVKVSIAANNARGGDTYFNGGGKVGIGTAAPAYPLDLSTAASNTRVRFRSTYNGDAGGMGLEITGGTLRTPAFVHLASNDGAGNEWRIGRLGVSSTGEFRIRNNAGADVMTLLQGGSVGIGTTGPLSKLSIGGAGTTDADLYIGNSAQNAAIFIDGGANGISSQITLQARNPLNQVVIKNVAGGAFTIDHDGTAGTEFAISTTGRVGIGTTGPGQKLDVSGTARVAAGAVGTGGVVFGGNAAIYSDTANLVRIRNAVDTGYASLDFQNIDVLRGGSINTPAGVDLSLLSAGTTGITIKPTGKVGIGTTNPNARLQVGNGDGETLQIGGTTSAPSGHKITFFSSNIEVGRIGLIDTVGSTAIGLFTYNGVSTTEKMRVDKNGNVGIGATSPGSRLEVENTASADDVLLLEDSSGLCEAQPTTTGLTWSCSSDIRLKSNIRNASSVLGYIAGIPLKDYTVIKTGENVTGPIAQELLGEYPELVRLGDDGYYQVSELSQWTLVKAIQELKQGNDKLKSENSQLKTKLSNLESRIAKLEG